MTYPMTNELARRFSTLLRFGLGALLFLPSFSEAAVEGIPCAPEPTEMNITYGDVVNCQIEQINDLDVFRFSGVSGSQIRVATAKRGGDGSIFFEVFGPDGALLCEGFTGADCPLTRAGRHTILVDEFERNQTVSYTLSLERIAPPSFSSQAIDHGSVSTGDIDGIGDLDAFYFGGQAQDLVRVQVSKLAGDGSPFFELFSADGTLVCAGFDSANCPLTQTGAHSILVSDDSEIDQTAQYSLTLECLVGACPDPPPPPVEAERAMPQSPIRCTGSRCRVPTICNRPQSMGSTCTNRIDLFVRSQSLRLNDDAEIKAPRRVRFAFATASIPSGDFADVRLRLTRRGKLIARTGPRSLRGVFEIRNAPGTVIDRTRVSIRIRRR